LTNKTDIPLSLAVWLAHDTYDHDPDPRTISATALLKPLRSLILGSRHDATGVTDISDLIRSRMGTAIHSGIEQAWRSKGFKNLLKILGHNDKLANAIMINPSVGAELPVGVIAVHMERRTKKELLGYKVSGKFDFVIDGGVRDFKSTKTYSYITQSSALKYVQQGSIYRWLNPKIITSDIMAVDYIFTDWSPVKALQGNGYPKHECMSQNFTLMGLEETEGFLKRKIQAYIDHRNLPEAQLPECTKEDLWQRDSVFKYYKNPAKRSRSTKNFTNMMDAMTRQVNDGGVGVVMEVPGEVVFCRYCSGASLCTQKDKYIKEGLLKL